MEKIKKYEIKTKKLRTDEYKLMIMNDLSSLLCKKNKDVKFKMLILSAYSNGMSQVCISQTFKIERKSILNWCKNYLTSGIQGLIINKRGVVSLYNDEISNEIRHIICIQPQDIGFQDVEWTGYMIKEYLNKKFNLNISYWLALKWMKMSGLSLGRTKKNFKKQIKKKEKTLK